MIYEAKILRVSNNNDNNDKGRSSSLSPKNKQYLVHYSGYKKSHDRWMTSTEMMKVNATSRRYYREIRGELSSTTTSWE
eukprot:CAMPEP_0201641736 /NCGR_PEP_ID=MMETSP0493-20130528/24790_1 /ASSEMBLY_ACC=CAM_ASM_000838 /TAXON_ID=420259 /ORGANISM="Thalassiosira gravida, Strain GMp14c1" /LENGTH=78 /DNA_ID=CAMNT_0048115725 /DNA_START=91 /DNA_END=327 /DNA_ORIENTATION=-